MFFITPRIFIERGMSLSRATSAFIAFIFPRAFFFLPSRFARSSETPACADYSALLLAFTLKWRIRRQACVYSYNYAGSR